MKPEFLQGGSVKKVIGYLNSLDLTPKEKRKILSRTLQSLKKLNVKHTRDQKTPEGENWKPRKKGRGRMLKRLAHLLNSQNNTEQGRLFYGNKRTREIAEQHNYGIPYIFKLDDKTKREGKKDPCTLQQAVRLRELGFKVKIGTFKSGKARFKRLTLREIRAKLTREQAGVIIRLMKKKAEGQSSGGKTQWKIPTTKRPFFETNDQVIAELMNEIISDFLNSK